MGGPQLPPGSLTLPGGRPSTHPSPGWHPGLEEPVCSIMCPQLKARRPGPPPASPACPPSPVLHQPWWGLPGGLSYWRAQREKQMFSPIPSSSPAPPSVSQMGPGWWVRLGSSLSPESAGWEKGSL